MVAATARAPRSLSLDAGPELLSFQLADLSQSGADTVGARDYTDDLEDLVSMPISRELLRTKRSRERLPIDSTADPAELRKNTLYPSFRTPSQPAFVPQDQRLCGDGREAAEGSWETIQTGVKVARSQRERADSLSGTHIPPRRQHPSGTEPGLASARQRSQSVQPSTPRAVSTSSGRGRAAISTKPSSTRELLTVEEKSDRLAVDDGSGKPWQRALVSAPLAPSPSPRRLRTPSTAKSTARLRGTPLSAPADRESYVFRLRSDSTAQDRCGDPGIPSVPQSAVRRTARASSTSRLRGPSPVVISWTAAPAQGEEDTAIPLPWTQSPAPVMYRTAQGDVQYADTTALERTSAGIGTAATIEGGAVSSKASNTNHPRPQDQILPAVARRLEAERLASEKVASLQDAWNQRRAGPARVVPNGPSFGQTGAYGNFPPEELPRPVRSPVQTFDQQSRRSRSPAQAFETKAAAAAEPAFHRETSSLATVSGDSLMNSVPLGPAAMSGQAGQASLIEVSESLASGRPALRQRGRPAQPDPASAAYEAELQRSGCCTACIVS